MTRLEMEIAGFAGKDAERPPTGPAAVASLAHTPRTQKDGSWQDAGGTVWVKVVCWQQNAGNTRRLLAVRKGEPVLVRGKCRVNTWTGSDGTERTELEIHDPFVVEKLARGDTQQDAPATEVPAWDQPPEAAAEEATASATGDAEVDFSTPEMPW